MQIKENINQVLEKQKKNIYYWIGVFGVADMIISLQHFIKYSQSHQCINLLSQSSSIQNCTLFEFVRNGIASLGFINIVLFVPLIVAMVFLTHMVDTIFAKENQE